MEFLVEVRELLEPLVLDLENMGVLGHLWFRKKQVLLVAVRLAVVLPVEFPGATDQLVGVSVVVLVPVMSVSGQKKNRPYNQFNKNEQENLFVLSFFLFVVGGSAAPAPQ